MQKPTVCLVCLTYHCFSGVCWNNWLNYRVVVRAHLFDCLCLCLCSLVLVSVPFGSFLRSELTAWWFSLFWSHIIELATRISGWWYRGISMCCWPRLVSQMSYHKKQLLPDKRMLIYNQTSRCESLQSGAANFLWAKSSKHEIKHSHLSLVLLQPEGTASASSRLKNCRVWITTNVKRGQQKATTSKRSLTCCWRSEAKLILSAEEQGKQKLAAPLLQMESNYIAKVFLSTVPTAWSLEAGQA